MPILFVALAISAFFMIGTSHAAGYTPLISTIDNVGDVIYYPNGAIGYGQGSGTLTVRNPAPLSPLMGVSITPLDGTTTFVDRIDPSSNYSVGYTILRSDIGIPLELIETIAPPSIARNESQQIRLVVEIKNIGDKNITDFIYQKSIPPGLSVEWTAYEGGCLQADNYVVYTLDNIGPGEKKNLIIALGVTPTTDIYFPEAYIWYTYHKSLTCKKPCFSGNTNTSFSIQKTLLGSGMWDVGVSVPDVSDFAMGLTNVTVYRSSVDDPFGNKSMIAYYAPNTRLEPGNSWNTSLEDYFEDIPVYFTKLSYYIPYTLEQKSYVTAKTVPLTVVVTGTVPSCTPVPTVIPMLTVTPEPYTPTPNPPVERPGIIFVGPYDGQVVTGNSIPLKVSVTPLSDPGYVDFYMSVDNGTWKWIGMAPVIDNMSTINWTIPQMSGKYYLKAERYNGDGFLGSDYIGVITYVENPAINLYTMMANTAQWYNSPEICFLPVLLLLLPLLLTRKRIVYDSSSLLLLKHKYDDWQSRLSRNAIRPDEPGSEFEEIEKLKPLKVKDRDKALQLEHEYDLIQYDALAIELVKENRAILYTADPRIRDICKKVGVKSKLIEERVK